jgi:quinol monooxygenase YgiN
MVVEYVRYQMPPGTSDALVEAYQVAGKSLQESPHCLGFELSRCVENPNALILRILWDSVEGHLEGFRTAPEFARFYGAIKAFVHNIDEMRHYEPTQVGWSR